MCSRLVAIENSETEGRWRVRRARLHDQSQAQEGELGDCSGLAFVAYLETRQRCY